MGKPILKNISIHYGQASELVEIQEFYTKQGYQSAIDDATKVLVARDSEKIAGVVRLVCEEGVLVLRGMQIHQDYQRIGLGHLMLRILEYRFEDNEVYCLPYDHLEEFYGLVKFEKIIESEAPLFLQERIQVYRERGSAMMMMKRPAIFRPKLETLVDVLSQWQISEMPLFLRKVENYVYEIKDLPYILRVTEKDHRNRELLQTELQWIDYLAEGGVRAARPIKNKEGEYLVEFQRDGKTHFACLFAKAPGKSLGANDRYVPKIYENLGKQIGKLHALTQIYAGPFERSLWSEEEGVLLAKEAVSPSDGFMAEKFHEIMNWASQLPKDKNSFGMIHGDPHQGNFFFDKNFDVTLFDFDDSHFCWFSYDLAVTVFSLRTRLKNRSEPVEVFRGCEAAFLEAYKKENKLDEIWFERIPMFVAYRTVLLYFWAKARIEKGDLEPDGIKRCHQIMDFTCLDLDQEQRYY